MESIPNQRSVGTMGKGRDIVHLKTLTCMRNRNVRASGYFLYTAISALSTNQGIKKGESECRDCTKARRNWRVQVYYRI